MLRTISEQPSVQRALREIAPLAAPFGMTLDDLGDGPTVASLVLAFIVALAGSLAVDALIAHVAVLLSPALQGYPHFRFFDYARLTILGVLGAAAGWWMLAVVSPVASRLYAIAAVVLTIVLFAPDIWILLGGAPGGGVLALMVMHVAVAFVVYGVMTRLAPARPRRRDLL